MRETLSKPLPGCSIAITLRSNRFWRKLAAFDLLRDVVPAWHSATRSVKKYRGRWLLVVPFEVLRARLDGHHLPLAVRSSEMAIYSPTGPVADQAAWDRAHRPKLCKLAMNPVIAQIVASKLRLQWSPEQIAGWLKREYPDDMSNHVSHETIYRTLYIQARGALKKELLAHLRRSRAMRRSRHHTQKTDNHGKIIDTVSISERPASIGDRAVPGHW